VALLKQQLEQRKQLEAEMIRLEAERIKREEEEEKRRVSACQC